MKKILIINGHPREGSLTDHLEQVYAEAARAEGAQVEILRLRELDFDPYLRSPREQSGAAMERDLIEAQAAISNADHLVWIYPNWWGTFPALMTGFIDRVLTPGFAFSYRGGISLPEKLLKGRTARLVVTMDGPSWWYSMVMGAGGDRAMRRSTLEFCGIKLGGITRLGSLKGAGEPPVAAHEARVRRAAKSDSR